MGRAEGPTPSGRGDQGCYQLPAAASRLNRWHHRNPSQVVGVLPAAVCLFSGVFGPVNHGAFLRAFWVCADL